MAEKTYTAWVHVEVEIDDDFHEIGGPAAFFKSDNLGEMVKFLAGLKMVPGHSLDIEKGAREIEMSYGELE